MKKFKCRNLDGKSCTLPVIVVVIDGRTFGRDAEVRDAFFGAVEQKYGIGYGIRFAEGINIDSLDSNSGYSGKGNLFKSGDPCPVGEEMLEDFKAKWDDVVTTYPDPEFRKELVKMEKELAKTPSAFPVLFLLCYTPSEPCFCKVPLSREDHNKILQNIIERYNMSGQNVDAVYVDTLFEDDNIFDPDTLPQEIEFGVPDKVSGKRTKIACKIFRSVDELKNLLLADEVFDVARLNDKNMKNS